MKPPLRRQPPGGSDAALNSTTAPTGRPLPMPHERDQALGSTAAEPDPVIQQAARDIEAGLVDTDLHGTPGMDDEKRQCLLEKERIESEAAMKGRRSARSKRREP